jgi:hypothetical protein
MEHKNGDSIPSKQNNSKSHHSQQQYLNIETVMLGGFTRIVIEALTLYAHKMYRLMNDASFILK